MNVFHVKFASHAAAVSATLEALFEKLIFVLPENENFISDFYT
jgi:hypothetical protein